MLRNKENVVKLGSYIMRKGFIYITGLHTAGKVSGLMQMRNMKSM